MSFKEWVLDVALHMGFVLLAFVLFCLACSLLEWMAQSWPGMLVLVIVGVWAACALLFEQKK